MSQPKFQSFIRGKVSIITAVLFLMFAFSVQAKKYPITWTPEKINETLSLGERKDITVTFVSNTRLRDVSVVATPSLQPFVNSIVPASFAVIEPNAIYSITFRIAVPSNTEPGIYGGTVQLRGSGTYPLPLRVRFDVKPSENIPPVANAGPDQTVYVMNTVTLDGSGSSDVDGDPLTYRWSLVSIPEGSTATLSDPSAVKPTFIADAPGSYVAQLIVNDGFSDSLPDTVTITTQNSPPVANAGPDQTVFVSDTVTLDGSASSDVDGDTLSFAWAIIAKPADSAATLSDAGTVMPTMVIDVPGTYILQLIVNDGTVDSAPDTVTIVTQNSPPVANAGPDQTVFVTDTVTLDGSASSDVDGDPLTFRWALLAKPSESIAELSGATSVTPTFVVDTRGVYVAQLIVNDGALDSAPDTVTITTGNSPPSANAGSDQAVIVGEIVILDGTGSGDVDNDPLTYQWSFTTKPEGSAAVIDDSSAAITFFVPDVAGLYIAQLVVNDGTVSSIPDTAVITVSSLSNKPPIALDDTYDIDEDSTLFAASVLGNDSDPDGDSMTAILVTDVTNGSLSLTDNGTFTYMPNENFHGTDGFTYIAFDGRNYSAIASVTITVNPVNDAPVAVAGPAQSVAVGETVLLDGNGSYDVDGDPLTYVWSFVSKPASSAAVFLNAYTAQPSFTADVDGVYVAQLVVNDGMVSSIPSSVSVTAGGRLPPDPATVAPPVDPTVATSMAAATSFIYSGETPIQTGVAPGTIESRRVAVLRGKVMDRGNNPLSGVTITILNHPEFGQTLSRPDGMFDMAVNGGGYLTVNYQKAGYLPAQRQINTPWQDYAWLPDVVLIQLDNEVTFIDLTSSEPMQVARGAVVTDSDGPRQATLLIPQGTQAQIILADGSTQSLTTLSIRATEYTIGPNGPKAMPAELPPTVGYTYAVELSADEALANGIKVNGKDVLFNQPVIFYVENFLNFPTGGIVPVGYYDSDKGAWIPYDNGRIIAVVGVTGGLADVDVNGDGSADTGAALSTLGITDQERGRLASLYTPPKSLWRVRLGHLSTWDCNWPYGPPPGATPPPGEPRDPHEEEDPCEDHGSIVECENQTLGHRIGITGTPFTLNYRSDRVRGRIDEYTIDIPLSNETIHPDLEEILLKISVAGHVYEWTFPPVPNQTFRFIWDGTDGYGRQVQGRQPIRIWRGYAYRARYYEPAQLERAFSGFGSVIFGARRARQQVILWKRWQGRIGTFDFRQGGVGAWSIDVHHTYDPRENTVYLGDGSRRRADSFDFIVNSVAGTGQHGFSGDGGPATSAKLWLPFGVVVGRDGSLYISDSFNHRIRRVSPDGIITTVAGTGLGGFTGDGGRATSARLNFPFGVAIGSDGSLYIADHNNQRIRRVSPDGIITTVAGTGQLGFTGDGGPATSARLYYPFDVAAGPDGSLYIADTNNDRIRRISPDGIITTVAGTGLGGFTGDGGPATSARLNRPYGVAVGPDGSLYIADTHNQRIRRVSPEGIIITVAGTGQYGFSGDGSPATSTRLYYPYDVAVGPDGSLYISEHYGYRIRRVGPDGIVTTVVGTGLQGYSDDGVPATSTTLSEPCGVEVDPDGDIYFTDGHRVFQRTSPSALLQKTEQILTSEDGNELYTFDSTGRHLRTLDALTNAVLYEFTYSSDGRLTGILDRDGNLTSIIRDVNGDPIVIVSPKGQTTRLLVDREGYLLSLTNPEGETDIFTYDSGGLITLHKNPRGYDTRYTYDDMGRLNRVEYPDGSFKTLNRTVDDAGYTIIKTTSLGRVTTYRMESLPTGQKRTVITDPSGFRREILVETDGSRSLKLQDGTVLTIRYGPDPRFGMTAPVITSLKLTTPGGLSYDFKGSLRAELNDPNDLLSLKTLTATVNVNGRTSTSVYNAATRTATTTTPAGRQSITTLDEKGRITRGRFANLAPLTVNYNAFGRIELLSLGIAGATRSILFGYDPDTGYLNSLSNPLGEVWRLLRDAAGRTTSLIRPDLEEIGVAYDANGNVVSIAPPGATPHRFSYDMRDALLNYLPPDLGGISTPLGYGYTADEELESIVRADGSVINLNYHPTSGYLSSIAWPESLGSTIFTYDATTGMLASMSSPGGESLTFGYDGFLPTRFAWSGAVNGAVNLTYNSDLRVSGIAVQAGTELKSWNYLYGDPDGLLSRAGDLTMTRDPVNGRLTGTSLGSVNTVQSYTNFGELALLRASYATTGLYEAEFLEYDSLGRVLRMRETIQGVSRMWRYVYDEAERLKQVWIDGSPYAMYDYDANGNRIRTEYLLSRQIVNAAYDPQDRLITWGDVGYEFDVNGYLSRRKAPGGTTAYTYDAQGALRSVGLPDGHTISYAIDPLGRRIGRWVNGVFDRGWIYQDSLNPVAEIDSAGNLRAVFVYGTYRIVPDYMVTGGQTYRLITDMRGSVRLVVDISTGAVVQRLDYDPWGRVLEDSNPGFQPFGYAGGLYDSATGLVRFGARDYDPEVGRWIARDPILFEGDQWNLYAYANDDPINEIDPSGNVAAAAAAALPAIWGGIEVGLSVYDIVDCFVTWSDPCASNLDRALCTIGTAAGFALPAGGYGMVARTSGRGIRESFPWLRRLLRLSRREQTAATILTEEMRLAREAEIEARNLERIRRAREASEARRRQRHMEELDSIRTGEAGGSPTKGWIPWRPGE